MCGVDRHLAEHRVGAHPSAAQPELAPGVVVEGAVLVDRPGHHAGRHAGRTRERRQQDGMLVAVPAEDAEHLPRARHSGARLLRHAGLDPAEDALRPAHGIRLPIDDRPGARHDGRIVRLDEGRRQNVAPVGRWLPGYVRYGRGLAHDVEHPGVHPLPGRIVGYLRRRRTGDQERERGRPAGA